MELEIRLRAINNYPYRGDFDESESISVMTSDAPTSRGIMEELKTGNSITLYIKANDIPSTYDVDKLVILSEINQEGFFYFTLPSTIQGQQRFGVRIIDNAIYDDI